MANIKTCDSCHSAITETNPIVAKLFLSPIVEKRTRAGHAEYSAHMDVGKCCFSKVSKMGWRKRLTRGEYHNGRRSRPATTVAEGSVRTPRETKRAGGGKV